MRTIRTKVYKNPNVVFCFKYDGDIITVFWYMMDGLRMYEVEIIS